MRILWVENHARFVGVTRRLLAGHDLTVVPSLAVARAALRSPNAFDAVLIDYDLDDGKGDALVRELRLRDGPRPAVVATSSHEDGNRALADAGADAVCGKLEFGRIAAVLAALRPPPPPPK